VARLRPGRRELLAAAVAGYGVLAVAIVGLLLWSALEPAEQSAIAAAAAAQAAVLVVLGVLAFAGFVALVSYLMGRYSTTARRLTAETRLLLHANPDSRLALSGPPELAELAAAVNELADQRAAAERDVAAQVAVAKADLEQERNRLATLMSELAVAVLVCTVEGRILLYNAAARSVVADDAVVGLGRSVFGIVDRALFAYAVDRTDGGARMCRSRRPCEAGRSCSFIWVPYAGRTVRSPGLCWCWKT
jgi:DNA polymerase-3 subunit epsilon